MNLHANPSVSTIRLPNWLRWSIYAVTCWLYLTGAVWLIARYGMRRPGEYGEVISPLEPWMLRLHGMAMILSLFLYGSLLRAHIIKAWQVRRNRTTGVIAVTTLLLLVLTGYLLYYAGDETTRPIISLAHWIVGLGLGIVLPFHIWYGRKLKADLLKLHTDRNIKFSVLKK